MTDIFKTKQKVVNKSRLFEIGVEFLQREGWRVTRIQGFGKSSVRRITKGDKSLKVTIRTSQDTWIAFPPADKNAKSWKTLSDVDVVLAVSLDGEDRTIANVHWIEADEMVKRFDRAYAARKAAGHTMQPGRGMWVSMYLPEADEPVNRVGGGIGLAFPAKATVPLEVGDAEDNDEPPITASPHDQSADDDDDEEPLTIAEAKRRLAKTFGVNETSIKITVEA